MLPLSGLSVCLSVCHVHALCRTAKDIERFLLHTTVPCASQIALKFALHWPFIPPKILSQSDPLPVDLSVGNIRWHVAAEWLEIVQWSQRRASKEPVRSFE